MMGQTPAGAAAEGAEDGFRPRSESAYARIKSHAEHERRKSATAGAGAAARAAADGAAAP